MPGMGGLIFPGRKIMIIFTIIISLFFIMPHLPYILFHQKVAGHIPTLITRNQITNSAHNHSTLDLNSTLSNDYLTPFYHSVDSGKRFSETSNGLSLLEKAAHRMSVLSLLPKSLIPSCKRIQTFSKYVQSLDHCWSGYNGFFLLNVSIPHPSLRGRVVGSAIQELNLVQLGQNTWGMFYFLPYGIYRAHIRIEFPYFDAKNFLHVTPINENIMESYSFSNPGLCPFGITKIPGYWFSHNEKMSAKMKAPWSRGAQPQLTLDLTDTEYIPRDCGLISQMEAKRCIVGAAPWTRPLRACLFGDSQMRHLHNALQQLLFPSGFFHYKTKDTDKRVSSSRFLKFMVDDWGTCFRGGPCPHNITDLSCNTVLLNFGQWQAGFPQGYPHTPAQYLDEVRVALLSASMAVAPRRLLWLTTHPYGEMPGLFTDPPKDWRSHTVLREYNAVAIQACKELGVDYIDVFNVASAVNDLSYDGKHYKLPVGREIGKLVFHELCVVSQI